MSGSRGPWRRYVALGDSLTEGMVDPAPDAPLDGGGAPAAAGADVPHRGWADRLAELLDAAQEPTGAPPLEYANLAVRGRLQRQVLEEQVPAALAMAPDLVSYGAGGNDLLRPGVDVRALAARTEEAVAALRAAGADVLLLTGADPEAAPVLRRARSRVADHNQRLWALARRQGAVVVDLWGLDVLHDHRMWAPDRLHLSSEGHARVAAMALAALRGDALARGQVPAWAEPLDPVRRSRVRTAAEDAAWVREHLTPWVGRRLTGRSSGDGRSPKRPVPTPVVREVQPPGAR